MPSDTLPKKTPWYADWFGDDYLLVYAHRDQSEARRMVDLVEVLTCPLAGCKILDLGCGSGRHAVEFAHRGYDVTGLDLSPTLLSEARRYAEDQNVTVAWLESDMRQTVTPSGFGLVVSLFTSFGYFPSDDENREVLKAISSNLTTDGNFVIDYLNRDWVKKTLVEYDEMEIAGGSVVQERWVSPDARRVEKRIVVKRDGNKERVYHESVRMYDLEEIEAMTLQAGLIVSNMRGDYDGGAYSNTSPRMILTGRREDALRDG